MFKAKEEPKEEDSKKVQFEIRDEDFALEYESIKEGELVKEVT